MAKSTAILRFVLFCLFFAVGVGAMALSILADEINDYYHSKETLTQTLAAQEKIMSLSDKYQSQIQQIQNDPNILVRLKKVTLGQDPTAQDTAFPKAPQKQLAAAAKALFKDLESAGREEIAGIPKWIQRCSNPKTRWGLFFCGAGLVLLAFIFFGAPNLILKSTDRVTKNFN